MTNKIKELHKAIETETTLAAASHYKLSEALQEEYNKLFARDKDLEKALQNLESASEYGIDDSGIYCWFRWNGLDDIAAEAREYFETYVSDIACVSVDWGNSCFQAFEGESITIQDDTRGGNGVWLDDKCIIDEKEYLDENGDVDERLRNQLIEAYMEKNGWECVSR